jgi:hypothetical protein
VTRARTAAVISAAVLVSAVVSIATAAPASACTIGLDVTVSPPGLRVSACRES